MGLKVPFAEEVKSLKEAMPLFELMAREIHAMSIYMSKENSERWQSAYNEAGRFMNEWKRKLSK